ncbi:unnamed protein product [Rotaria sp. Silwood2]|nr:unnamed protein product [Rotaria sp. Silwood2]
MNNSSIDTIFSHNTQNLTPDHSQVRVKFTYSFDNDQLLPIKQTTLVKMEPCFNVIASEDELTKHFYQNKLQVISKKYDTIQDIQQQKLNESDSVENEYSPQLIKERELTHRDIDDKHATPNHLTYSSSKKSILKKSQRKKEERSIPKKDQLSISRSTSLSSSTKPKTSSNRLDFNQVLHLAEVTSKQYASSYPFYSRSLFDQTFNIFDPNRPSYMTTNSYHRPFRFQYYMKPYREQVNIPMNMNKQRSRSLSPNHLAQQSNKTSRSNTFTNQHARTLKRQLNRKQHISWSPFSFRMEKSSKKTNSSLSTRPSLSLMKSCQQNSPSNMPVLVYHQIPRTSQSSSSSPLPVDSYHTPSTSEYSLTSVTPVSLQPYNNEEEKSILKSHLPDIVYQHQKEHDETMERYERMLEKMRATDVQLQSLSRPRQVLENYRREFFNG